MSSFAVLFDSSTNIDFLKSETMGSDPVVSQNDLPFFVIEIGTNIKTIVWGEKEIADFRHTLSRLTASPLHPMRKSTPFMGHVTNDGVYLLGFIFSRW